MAPEDSPSDRSAQVPQIRPLPYEVAITPRPDAADDLVAIGQRYWALVGLDELNRVVWAQKATAINGGTRPHIAAAAGVVAEIPGVSCAGCAVTPWQPRSRTALDELLRGHRPAAA